MVHSWFCHGILFSNCAIIISKVIAFSCINALHVVVEFFGVFALKTSKYVCNVNPDVFNNGTYQYDIVNQTNYSLKFLKIMHSSDRFIHQIDYVDKIYYIYLHPIIGYALMQNVSIMAGVG